MNSLRSRIAPTLLAAAVLLITTAQAGTFLTSPWTHDASSYIEAGKTVWAVHFGSTTTPTVQGVSVPGFFGPTASDANFDLTGTTDVYWTDDTNNVTGAGSAEIARRFVYGGSAPAVTVKGLTPGQAYTLTFFSVGFEAPGGRPVTFSSGSDSWVVDQSQFGDNNGIRVDYTFTATATTRTITLTPNTAATWHHYGLALRNETSETLLAVTSTADSGAGSLRWALANAATLPGPDSLTFAPALAGQTITLVSEIAMDMTQAGDVTVDASSLPGGLTLSGGFATRIFSLSNTGAPFGAVTLVGLTLTGGNGTGASGFSGGAILNRGTLTLRQCTLSGNNSIESGGAISNSGTLTATHCTFFDNTATINGGAVGSNIGSIATFSHCTFFGNGQGDSSQGGGAINHAFSAIRMTLTHCTISGNHATGSQGGGGIRNRGPQLTLENCIVAGNTTATGTDEDISNTVTITRSGANLIRSAPSGFFTGPDPLTADPLLAPLGAYGGPTLTMALLPGSPAMDAAAILSPPLPTDQRGLPRQRDGDATAGALPDIGAYEVQLAPVGSLGFNFNGHDPRNLLPNDRAGAPGFAQTHWNNLGGDSGSGPQACTLAGGASVTVRAEWDGPNIWHFGLSPVTPDEKLMRGYLDSDGAANSTANLSNPQNQPFFALADLPSALTLGGYKVVVYADTDSADGRTGEYWLTPFDDLTNASGTPELSPRLFLRDSANFAGTYTRVPATSTTRDGAAAGNYLVFENQTQPGFILRTEDHPSFRAVINAVQVIRNEILVVTTAADENDPVGTLGTGLSLREAIQYAAPGSGIVFDPAVFNGEPADSITFLAANPGLVLDKDLTLDASNIPGGVSINAAASSTNPKRVFTVNAGRTVALAGLNLTGAYNTTLDAGNGGAIHSQGRLSLTDCRVTGHTANEGAAVFVHSATQTAITTLRRCLVQNNQGLNHAAGIELWADYHAAELHLEDCTFSANVTPGFGGALWTYAEGARGSTTAIRCTITDNQAFIGGGVSNQSLNNGTAELILRHCTLHGNTATGGGGAVITGNTGSAGATAPLTLAHTLVAGNNAPLGPEMINEGGTITSLGGNLIGKTDGSGASWLGSDLTGTVAAPREALLAPLGDYGGPTPTKALRPGSPARNAAFGSTTTADQRGFPVVGIPDIGAYEAGTPAPNYHAFIWESLPTTAPIEAHAGTADFDGDSRTNEAEWVALTDPASPGGFFRLAQGSLVGGTFHVTFPTAVGRVYQLQSSPTLGIPSWTNVGGPVSGTGGNVTRPADPPGAAPLIFRAIVQVP
jgi:CSLREA domain-containing protein